MASDLIAHLRENDIIPAVIPDDQVANLKGEVKIHYPKVTVSKGEHPARADTQEQPVLEYEAAEPSASYTVIMLDPDLILHNDPINGHVRHWLQSGVLFDGSTKRSIGSLPGNTTSYVGPAPGPGSAHRYIFIVAREPPSYVAKQDKDYPVSGDSDLKGRLKWNTAQYCKEEGLKIEGVGWMRVSPDLGAIVDNVRLTTESLVNKVKGK
ncbi:hypothetical protein JCM1841_004383 [Sporobolomyces salmonicolor]